MSHLHSKLPNGATSQNKTPDLQDNTRGPAQSDLISSLTALLAGTTPSQRTSLLRAFPRTQGAQPHLRASFCPEGSSPEHLYCPLPTSFRSVCSHITWSEAFLDLSIQNSTHAPFCNPLPRFILLPSTPHHLPYISIACLAPFSASKRKLHENRMMSVQVAQNYLFS